MSRNARNNENGTLDEILSKRVNFHGFDDFDQFWSISSKRKSARGFDDFDEYSPFRYCMHFWTYLTYDVYSKCLFQARKSRRRTRIKETRDRVATDPGQTLFLPLEENWWYLGQKLLNLHRYFAGFFLTRPSCSSDDAIRPKVVLCLPRRNKDDHTIQKLKTGKIR